MPVSNRWDLRDPITETNYLGGPRAGFHAAAVYVVPQIDGEDMPHESHPLTTSNQQNARNDH